MAVDPRRLHIDDFDREVEWPDPDPRDSRQFSESWAKRILLYKVLVHMEKRMWPFVTPQEKVLEMTEPGEMTIPGGGWVVVAVEFVERSDGEA